MATYLDRILEFHRARAAADRRSLDELMHRAAAMEAPRGFRDALLGSTAETADATLAVISEVKRRSPSKGDLFAELDPAGLAHTYEAGGAACLSVLTDEHHFGGSANDLAQARAAVSLPVLRKDFTVCALDVVDARLMGADCVLLIVAALSDEELANFDDLAAQLGLDVLVETHDEAEVERALRTTRGTLIGVNQRDLETFEVDQDRAVRVAATIPDGVVKVAESGVRGRSDAEALAAAGYDAVLVGEHLVTSGDPGAALAALKVRRPPHHDR